MSVNLKAYTKHVGSVEHAGCHESPRDEHTVPMIASQHGNVPRDSQHGVAGTSSGSPADDDHV